MPQFKGIAIGSYEAKCFAIGSLVFCFDAMDEVSEILQYVVEGFTPKFVADFGEEFFFSSGSIFSTTDLITTGSRASVATKTDANGNTVMVPVGEVRYDDHVYDPGTMTWVNKGILLEPAATQLNPFSDTLAPAGGKGITINGNVITANASNGQHRYGYSFTSAGGAVTVVCELEQINDRFFQCYDFTGAGIFVNYLNFDAVLGVVTDKGSNTTGYAEPVGPNKWKLVVTFGADVPASGNIRYGFLDTGTDPHGATVNTIGVEQWGLSKLNAFDGTKAYSYFPTNGAVGVRAADPAGVTIPAALMPVIGQNETTGTELITNGKFDSGTASFLTVSSPSVTDNGNGTVTVGRTVSAQDRLYQSFSTTVGTIYKVEVVTSGGTAPWDIRVANNTNFLSTVALGSGATNSETASFTFTATATTTFIGLSTSGNGTTATYDNISVKEVDPPAFTIQIEGDVTFEDNDTPSEVSFFVWPDGITGSVDARLRTNVGSGQFQIRSVNLGNTEVEQGGADDLPPGVGRLFNACATYKDGFIGYSLNGAADDGRTGTNTYANFTPSNFLIAPNFHGHVKKVVVWNEDITSAGRETASFLDVPDLPVAPDPVDDLVATSSLDGTTAILNWTTPNLNGGVGEYYTARVTQGGDQNVLLDEIPADATSYEFSDFSPGANLTWTLTLKSSDGTSLPSNAAFVSLANYPDEPEIILVSVSETEAIVSITEPNNNGSALLDYELEKIEVS